MKNVFVIGLDEFVAKQLEDMPGADAYAFHPLLPVDEVAHTPEYDIPGLLAKAEAEFDAFAGNVDAIVGYWDFPTTSLLPILRRRRGLRSPSLESVLKCEHKFWSRLVQAEAVPEHVPRFQVCDPFAADPLRGITLAYPFWIKPVKSHSSQLGFRIGSERDFRKVLPVIRAGIERLGDPFNHVLEHARLPVDVSRVGGNHCLVEEIISGGRQCTLEGYVQNGAVRVYGVVDSVRDRRYRSCFSRYEYPSMLPRRASTRMIDIAARVLEHIGFDDSPFNMEFYYEKSTGRIWLLEINPRISRSHSPLFEMVDGASHLKVMVDVALGMDPNIPRRRGQFGCAAKFMLRAYEGGVVAAVPGPRDIARVQETFPDTLLELNVEVGRPLQSLLHQDAYSYEVAVLFMGARNHRELLANYYRCAPMLPIRIARPPAAGEADERVLVYY